MARSDIEAPARDRERLVSALRRRTFINLYMTGVVGVFARQMTGSDDHAVAATTAPFKLTDAEWRKRLSPQAYAEMRKASTEQPFTSPLLKEHRKGRFVCAGCALPLISCITKFDSGTGWQSF